MAAYPHNLTISGKSPWPWAARQVRLEGDMYLTITRSLGLHWHKRVAKDLENQLTFTLKKQALGSPHYLFEEANCPPIYIRSIQLGHWVCKSAKEELMVYKLGGSKSIISHNGCQIAIMSIQPGFALFNDHKVHLRVNEEEYLHLSIAMALLLDDYNLRLSTNIFPQAEVSTLQTG